MPIEKYRYVVVEGPVGVGKTSLARRLAQHIGAATLLEKPGENPFLARFYQDPPRYALATQLFFLFQRGNEVRDLAQMDMFRQNTVADYLFDKDMLFARLNLSDTEFPLYQQIYRTLQLQVPAPDLVIYLQAHCRRQWPGRSCACSGDDGSPAAGGSLLWRDSSNGA